MPAVTPELRPFRLRPAGSSSLPYASCAIWDRLRDDRESIPTIIASFNKSDLIDQRVDEARSFYANQAPPESFHLGDGSQDIAARKSWWKQDKAASAEQVENHTTLAFIGREQGRRHSKIVSAEGFDEFLQPLHRP
jgi:hypothetical protein